MNIDTRFKPNDLVLVKEEHQGKHQFDGYKGRVNITIGQVVHVVVRLSDNFKGGVEVLEEVEIILMDEGTDDRNGSPNFMTIPAMHLELHPEHQL